MKPFDYKFQPTSGIPMTSHTEKTPPGEKVTWFSTIGPEQARLAEEYYKEKGKNMDNHANTENTEVVLDETITLTPEQVDALMDGGEVEVKVAIQTEGQDEEVF